MEKELLQKALDSILHGSTQIVTTTDYNGNTNSHEVRINDLRQPLVSKLAEYLAKTEEFKKALANAFTLEVTKKIQESMLANLKYSDLPYDVKRRIESEMKDLKVQVKAYKLVAEVIKE